MTNNAYAKIMNMIFCITVLCYHVDAYNGDLRTYTLYMKNSVYLAKMLLPNLLKPLSSNNSIY